MHSLLPRLHPITVALLTFILVICELFGGASDGGVSFAIAPFVAGAAILGGAVLGSSIIGGIAKARQDKEAIRRYQNSPEYAALSSINQAAALRQRLGTTGLGPAAQRQITEEAGFKFMGMMSKAEADAHSGSADPMLAAQKTEQVKAITEGATKVATTSTGGAAKLSGEIGAQQTRQDIDTIKGGASQELAVQTGKAAAAKSGIEAVTGGVRDVGTVGLGLMAAHAGQGGGQRAAAGATGAGMETVPPVGAP